MGYYERLGEILRDRLNSDDDPFAADFECASDFTCGGEWRKENSAEDKSEPGEKAVPKRPVKLVSVPNELAEDFLVLGLRPGEPMEECKSAWKLMLKIHHPDRHQNSEYEKKIAEQTTINLTRSYRRIKYWFATGELPPD